MKHPSLPLETEPIEFVVDEYEVDELAIAACKPKAVKDGDETRMLSVFDDLVDDEGRLMIVIRCLDRSQYLGDYPQWDLPASKVKALFPWNLTKAYISIWLQMTMVIAFRCDVQYVLERPGSDGGHVCLRVARFFSGTDLRHAALHRLQYQPGRRSDRVDGAFAQAGCDDNRNWMSTPWRQM